MNSKQKFFKRLFLLPQLLKYNLQKNSSTIPIFQTVSRLEVGGRHFRSHEWGARGNSNVNNLCNQRTALLNMSTFCVVVTYGSTVKRDSACARCRAETLSTCLCRQANAVSELIPVKPDGIINGRHRYGPRRLQFDLFRLSALI